jgi:hypothetical protein
VPAKENGPKGAVRFDSMVAGGVLPVQVGTMIYFRSPAVQLGRVSDIVVT